MSAGRVPGIENWGNMKTALRTAAAILAIGLLSGCSGATADNAAPTPAATSAAPTTAPPAPVVLDKKQAGKFYLENICLSNKAGAAMYKEYDEKGNYDLKKTKAAARKYQTALRDNVEKFSPDVTAWPASVKDDVEALNEDTYKVLAGVGPLASAGNKKDLESAWYSFFAANEQTNSGSVGQKSRAKLDLPADTKASCK